MNMREVDKLIEIKKIVLDLWFREADWVAHSCGHPGDLGSCGDEDCGISIPGVGTIKEIIYILEELQEIIIRKSEWKGCHCMPAIPYPDLSDGIGIR